MLKKNIFIVFPPQTEELAFTVQVLEKRKCELQEQVDEENFKVLNFQRVKQEKNRWEYVLGDFFTLPDR